MEGADADGSGLFSGLSAPSDNANYVILCSIVLFGRMVRAASPIRWCQIAPKKPCQLPANLTPEAEIPLRAWARVAENAVWEKFYDVKETYAPAIQVGKFTVFNIGGNKFRLVVVIHFNRGKVYLRYVMTHEEYDKDDWKND
jgi:mRNA interferase HigB